MQTENALRENDPLFIDHVSELDGVRRREHRRGVLSHISWASRVPSSLWNVSIPRREKHSKWRQKGLSAEEVRLVTRVLERARHRTDIEAMLYYRNRAIWKFMLMTLVRKGELVRTRLEDLDQRTGYVHLLDRPDDEWLGELKTGPGNIYVTSHNPYWSAVNAWLMDGRWIAERILKERGDPDHGMLFCNRDGGPLTQAAVDHLFASLNQKCRFSRPLHPHVTRHTMGSLLLDAGLELTEVQKLLRHESIASTEIYAQVSDLSYREALEAFWRGLEVLI